MARHADGTLWLYPADGTGRVADLTRQQVRQFTRPGDEGHIDPATFRQLVSLGDLGQPGQAASPDFLAVIGDALWYLPGFGGGYLDEGYPLADSGWAGRTLVPTGDLDGDGRPDLLVRDTADGKLWLYRGRAGADGSTDPLSLADDTRRTAYGTGFTPPPTRCSPHPATPTATAWATCGRRPPPPRAARSSSTGAAPRRPVPR